MVTSETASCVVVHFMAATVDLEDLGENVDLKNII
jgi:hypothetical protein